MTDSLTITVLGTPTAQGSKRAFIAKRKDGTQRAAMTEQTGPKLRTWRGAVSEAAQTATPGATIPVFGVPVTMSVWFRIKRPRSHYRTGRNAHLLKAYAPPWPTAKTIGDISKLLRSTEDALVDAGVLDDDSLIVIYEHVTKTWASPIQLPGATIHIRPA